MVRINLLPTEIVEKRKYERYYPYIFIAGGVMLAIVLVTWLALQVWVGQRNDQLQQAEETVNALNTQAAALAIFEEQQQALDSRQNVATQALAGRMDMGKIMEEVSLVLPDPLWIEELILNQDDGMTLTGYTPDSADAAIDESYKSIAAGLVRINSLDNLEDVWLTNAESDVYSDFQGLGSNSGDRKTVGFSVSARIVDPSSETEASTAVPAPPATAGE